MKINKKYTCFFVVLLLVCLHCDHDNIESNTWNHLKLWYDKPAIQNADSTMNWDWNRALPVGNGRMGAMVFGGTTLERIQLNEESIWAGPPVSEPNPSMARHIETARKALFNGNHDLADSLIQLGMGKRISPRSYQTLGDLWLEMDDISSAKEYHRELDLDKAMATTRFEINDVVYTRKVFASAVDDVIVVKLDTEPATPFSLNVRFTRPVDYTVEILDDHSFKSYGLAQHNGENQGVNWQMNLTVEADADTLYPMEKILRVEGAKSTIIYITCTTDYNRSHPDIPLNVNFNETGNAILDAARSKSYRKLEKQAIKTHRDLFRRCSLDLGGWEAEHSPIDMRLENFSMEEDDPALIALMFQYGRYLLIGSSRPGTMPANLQGIWNEHIDAPWNSDYHLNINLQMNYWPAEVTNLSECHLPMLQFVEGLLPNARELAQIMYNARGAATGHTTDAWKFCAVQGNLHWGAWPHGFAWCARHFMEHYRFTGDMDFLKKRALPIIKEAVLFYLDYIVEDPVTGELVAGPDISPENSFIGPDGNAHSISMGTSMSQQIIWEIFSDYIEAAEVLGENDEFLTRVHETKKKLYLPQIGEDGRLMEWKKPYREKHPGHRHMSHLYAVYPGYQYNTYTGEEYLDACRKSIEYRLQHGGAHTGWSRAWIINFFARFQDGNEALKHIRLLLEKSTYPNLFDAHPPFQIDGNFGATAGIAEMLLQSHILIDKAKHACLIELLPALPDAWMTGNVYGLKAREGFEVDIVWREGELIKATITSLLGNHLYIKYGDAQIQKETSPGEIIVYKP